MRCRCACAGAEYGVPPETGALAKDPVGALGDVDAELVGECPEESETSGVGELGDALVEVLLAEGAVVTDGPELAVPLAQDVRASSAIATPTAVPAIDRRPPHAACTAPVSSRREPRHHGRALTAPDRDSGELGG
jgi:hypothetical protein